MSEAAAPSGATLGEDRAEAVPKAPPPSFWTKLAYGFGSVAYGVKDQGFAYFLVIFYSQVVGLDPRLAGLAVTIALALDALSDPVVGYWSDNLRSRWGRRHPFMYASALPVAATYFLLWTPPEGWSQQALFWYVLVLAVLIRTFITFYETPSSALAPELTEDYDQRSSLLSFRYFFGWCGGNAMTVGSFLLLFPAFATPAIPNGQFNRDAYQVYGIVASVLIFVAIVVSAAGTHSRIVQLKPPPPQRKLSLPMVFAEIFQTLGNRSFLALFVAAMFGSIAAGLSATLAFYFLTYMWGFSSQQNGLITMSVFASALIGATLAPVVTRTIGKKRGAMIIGLIAVLGSPLAIILRLAGIMPPNGDPFIFWFVFFATLIDVGLIICFQILSASMMADLVEQAELKTGRRSEGVFFAASTFIRKMVTGLGVMTATTVLTLAQFPVGVDPTRVPQEAVLRLGACYVPVLLGLYLAMMAVISTYKLNRQEHEENLRKLAERRAAQ